MATMSASGLETIPASLATLVKLADVIVVGSARHPDVRLSSVDIAVDEVLKGRASGKHLPVLDFDGDRGSPLYYHLPQKKRATGVFFVVKDRDTVRTTREPAFFPLSERGHVVRLLAMLEDLKRFVDDPDANDDDGLVQYVGEAFATPAVHCEGADWLDAPAAEHWAFAARKMLFRDKSSWPIHIRYDTSASPETSIVEPGRDPELSAWIEHEIQTQAYDFTARARRFTSLDVRCQASTDWPMERSHLKARDAVRYVRSRLKSRRLEVVISAITALELMHDGDAVPLVEPLSDSKNPQLAAKAGYFLYAADSPR